MDQPLISADAVLAALHWRYATKKFDPGHRLSDEDWSKLEQALILSPSSYGLQPYRFVVVTDPAIKESLKPHAYNQPQIVACSHLVVFAHRTDITEEDVDTYLARIGEVRGLDAAHLEGLRGMMVGDLVNGARRAVAGQWAARQAYIALGNLMTVAALTSVDVCPMEGFSAKGFNEVLALPAHGLNAVVLAAVGHRAADDGAASLPKVRKTPEALVDHRW